MIWGKMHSLRVRISPSRVMPEKEKEGTRVGGEGDRQSQKRKADQRGLSESE